MELKTEVRKGSTLMLARLAMGGALAFVGSLVNIPIGITTLALDSMPGFTYALLFGGFEGAVVAALGHFMTAWLRGFPFSLPVHLIVMAGMAVAAWSLSFFTQRVNQWFGSFFATLVNGVMLPAVLIPILGMPFFLSGVLPLTLVAGFNIGLSLAVVGFLRRATR